MELTKEQEDELEKIYSIVDASTQKLLLDLSTQYEGKPSVYFSAMAGPLYMHAIRLMELAFDLSSEEAHNDLHNLLVKNLELRRKRQN